MDINNLSTVHTDTILHDIISQINSLYFNPFIIFINNKTNSFCYNIKINTINI